MKILTRPFELKTKTFFILHPNTVIEVARLQDKLTNTVFSLQIL